MSNFNEADFAALYRTYKQLESENQRSDGIQPQHPIAQAHRPPAQRFSPARPQPQPYRQTPLRNASEFTTLFRMFDEMKKRQEDTNTNFISLLDMFEQLKLTVERNMAIMNGNMQRFEIIGRGVLNMALHPSNSQPPNSSSSQPQTSSNPPSLNQHASQQQTSSNSQKPYGQGSNVTEPPMPFVSSQTLEDATYFDSYGLDFSGIDTS